MQIPHGETTGRSRRDVLRGAALIGGAAAVGAAAPALWRQDPAQAAAAPGPQWISLGPAPGQMYVTWSSGSAGTATAAPTIPAARWGTSTAYGNVAPATASQVPLPVPPVAGEPPELTWYVTALLAGLSPATAYHYAVSSNGTTWGPDAVFTTPPAGLAPFRFTAFGDQAAGTAAAVPMAQLAASLRPAFHLLAGDLAYATPAGLKIPDVTGFHPAQWDAYRKAMGPALAQSVPQQASVGAHETEPLGDDGYAGFVTRFPQNYDAASGSPVVQSYTCGNVAFIHLDGNDLSAQEPVNAGYSNGAQTAWLAAQLPAYRAAGSGVDFIVVIVNCCCYSSNREHGSDGALRAAWGPLFDASNVDLVISGHVHAYERTNPMIAGQPTAQVPSGGTVSPATQGTTYVCAGTGGNALYRTWYGTTLGGDAGNATAPKVWRINAAGKPQDYPDTAEGYSAYRQAAWAVLCVDVTPPAAPGGETSMLVRALMPAQTGSAVTSITSPAVMDSVTLTRTSQA